MPMPFLLPVMAAVAVLGSAPDAPAVVGLDHIPIAVADLEKAAERYRALGFALKPGRPHDNGIRNQHVKFTDGTELELITAPEARDALTTTYRRHLAAGDGPAFLALFAPSFDRAAARLAAAGAPFRRQGRSFDFGEAEPLRYLFLGPRNHSPTDRPEHFAHANGAESLVAVWLAADDLGPERRLLEALGATMDRAEVHVPGALEAAVARLHEGEVRLLPAAQQVVPGRRIVGATLRVRSLEGVKRVLGPGAWTTLRVVRHPRGASVFLPPAMTHGLWLELREDAPAPTAKSAP
jgi:catechol 2,3-dioxygenase-like lactoylglutathione lyase family enzyme